MLSKSALRRKHFGVDDDQKMSQMRFEDTYAVDRPVQDWVKLSLPYYAPDSSLPPIPTAEDVEMARPEKFASSHRNRVYRVNSAYAVKFSINKILLHEAENLLFLQEQEVRAPKLYALFSHQGADPLGLTIGAGGFKPKPRSKLPTYYYLVMDYLDGVTLDDETWEQVDPEARVKVYGKIAEQLRLLRSIPAPNPSYYGRIHHQPYEPTFAMVRYRCRDLVGPFDSYADFLQQVWETLEVNAITTRLLNRVEFTPEMKIFGDRFNSFFDNVKHGEPVLSHMDLKLDNMMLVPSQSNSSTRLEDYDLYIIDWERMCWLPAWAEIAGARQRLCISSEEEHMQAEWEVFKGIKPFHFAEAFLYSHCCGVFGGTL